MDSSPASASRSRLPSPAQEPTKNDQCRVEQKNGAIVRRFVGYDRYESIRPCRILSELYQTLQLYVNYFQSSLRLLSKKREDAEAKKP